VSVHEGNGFKLRSIYLVVFVPLLLIGPGKLSANAVIRSCFASS